VLVRTGFDLNKPYKVVPPLATGDGVTIAQMGRVEAQLGPGATGLDTTLPIGAHLDAE